MRLAWARPSIISIASAWPMSRATSTCCFYATKLLLKIPGLRIIGTAKEKAGVLSFVMDGFRTEEIGDYLNRKGIAVRGGHHCAQPILRRFGLESTVRATLALYNTCEESMRWSSRCCQAWRQPGGRHQSGGALSRRRPF
jgi:hypothetical protein